MDFSVPYYCSFGDRTYAEPELATVAIVPLSFDTGQRLTRAATEPLPNGARRPRVSGYRNCNYAQRHQRRQEFEGGATRIEAAIDWSMLS